MTTLKTTLKEFWNDESAQGATEYILLLVVVVGIAMMFRGQIQTIMRDKIDQLSSDIGGFSSQ